VAEEYDLYLVQRLSEDRSFEEGALYAGKNALIYDSVQEEGNIYTVLKNSSKKYVDRFEVIKGELYYFALNEQEGKWAEEIGIKVSPYQIDENGVLLSSNTNVGLMDEATGSIIIPQAVTKIGEGAFANIEGLKTIVIPGTVKEIGGNAFRANKTIEKVIIQEGVEIIGGSAFQECGQLKEIELPESIIRIDYAAFYICTNLKEIEIPSKITRIERLAFSICRNLSKVTFRGDKVTAIDHEAFFGTSFSELHITKNINSINATAFNENTNLKDITIDGNNFYYEEGMLMPKDRKSVIFLSQSYYKEKTELKIPEGVVNFETSIANLGNLKKLIITKDVTAATPSRHLPSSIETIEVQDGNTKYAVDDNDKCLYTKTSPKTLVFCYSKKATIELKSNYEKIGDFAFNGAPYATKIILNKEVKSIGNQIFSNAHKVTEFEIKDEVNYIDPGFCLTKYGIKVTIDNNKNYIVENNILYSADKSKLITVISKIQGEFIVDSKVKEIVGSAFYSQREMTGINLNSIEKINNNAFYDCRGLRSIEIPKSIKEIGEYAFSNMINLKEVIIHKEKDSIKGCPWGSTIGDRLEVKWQA